MQVTVAGIEVISSTHRGAFVEATFRLAEANAGGNAEGALAALLRFLPESGEVSILEPDGAECYHECQSTLLGLQIKRGCHGAAGTWRPASAEEAIAWLLPGILRSAAQPSREQASIRIPATSA